jgi:cytochrome c peroxidase
VKGDATAISPAAKRGFDLFNGKAGCANCHSGASFTDGSFQDIGTANGNDIGRARLFPSSNKLHYAFKVPTLRDVARRAPYMHDGSVPTLEAVIDLYDNGGIDRPSRSELIHPLGLTPQEKTDLIAFLQTLTGAPRSFDVPVLPR